MADTLVETNINSFLDAAHGLWGPYWSDTDTAIIVFVDAATDISFARTTDKGASWSTTVIEAGTATVCAAWYDKETPGNTGTLVHILWLARQATAAKYVTVDVADASVGTIRAIDNTITVAAFEENNRCTITQAVNGNLIVAFSTQTEIECYRSDDGGVTWVDRADVYETATEEDWCLLFPANVDAGDACAMFWDRSADEITLKMFDESANSWTEFATAIAAIAVDDTLHINMDGSVRHSDNHVLAAWHSDDDTADDDVKTADLTVDSIASPTVTAKTDVVTDQAESGQVSVFINQQNDHVYVAHMKGGTWAQTVDVVFHISTDGMGSWGTEQAYSESAADDFRLVHAGRTVGAAGGRYQPSFYDDDEIDIYVNETHDIEIGSGGVHRGAAVLSGVGSVVAVAALTLPASAAISGIGTLVAAGTIGVIHEGAAVLSGVGTLTLGTPVRTLVGQSSMLGEGSLVAVGERGALAAAVLDGVGTLTVFGEVGIEGRAALAGVGSMSVLAQRIVPGIVDLSGAGSLVVVGSPTLVGAATLSGVGTLAVIGETGDVLFTIFGGVLREIDPDDYPTDAVFTFEATLAAPSGGTARARLYNITDAAAVADSDVATANPEATRRESAALTLPSGPKLYRAEYGGATGQVYTIFAAALRVESD